MGPRLALDRNRTLRSIGGGTRWHDTLLLSRDRLARTLVLIAELPPLLRDIVIDTIGDRSDIAVVGVVEPHASIASAVDRTGATVVIVRAGPTTSDARARLLERGADAPVIVALAGDGRAAVVELALGEISPECLVQAVRRVSALREVVTAT